MRHEFDRRHLAAVEVGLLMLLESILGPLWAWLGLGQRPNPQMIAAGVVIFVSLAIYAVTGMGRYGDRAALAE